MTLITALAIGGLVFVFSGHTARAPARPPAIESVSPQGGDLDLRQVTISADLAAGYTGTLLLDGVEIPEDDLQHVDPLNQVILKPTPDSDFRELQPGHHCATVVYWPIGQRRDDSQSYRWCFDLH
jgi:hypothetical protein